MSPRFPLLLVLIGSAASASAADPFMVFDRMLPSAAAELRPAVVCDTPAPSGSLTQARAVERALCASPATRSAWLAARLRASELGQANSEYLPELALDGSVSRNGSSALPNDNTAWQVGLSAQYLLYDFGGRTARRDAAEALLTASLASHDAATRVLYLQTVTAYFNLLTRSTSRRSRGPPARAASAGTPRWHACSRNRPAGRAFLPAPRLRVMLAGTRE